MSDKMASTPIQQVPIRTSATQKLQSSSASAAKKAVPPPTKPSSSNGHGPTAPRPGISQVREEKPSGMAPSGHSQPPSAQGRPSSSHGQLQALSGGSTRGNSISKSVKTQNEGAFQPPPPPPIVEGSRPSPTPGAFMAPVRAAIQSGQLKG